MFQGKHNMNVLLVFGGSIICFTMIVLASKLTISSTFIGVLSGLAYTALAAVVWFGLWASGSGLATASITATLMLATIVPTIEWVRRRR